MVPGLVVATALGLLLYLGSLRLDLGKLFSVAGLLLLSFAAGLLAHGVHQFQEVGLLPLDVEHVWSTKALLNDGSVVGSRARSLPGYNGDPSLLEAITCLGYLAVVGRTVLVSLLVPIRRASARPA
jgi:high-affinity iron transporter